jgi:hypothetical protein
VVVASAPVSDNALIEESAMSNPVPSAYRSSGEACGTTVVLSTEALWHRGNECRIVPADGTVTHPSAYILPVRRLQHCRIKDLIRQVDSYEADARFASHSRYVECA